MAKGFLSSEVRTHASRDDIYILINQKVYDVTAFVNSHPGGEELLLTQGGQDATDVFDEVGHSDDAKEQLNGMLVGILIESEKAINRGIRDISTSNKSKVKNDKSNIISFYTIGGVMVCFGFWYVGLR